MVISFTSGYREQVENGGRRPFASHAVTIIRFGSKLQSHFNKNTGANHACERSVRLAGPAARPWQRSTGLPAAAPAAPAGDPVAGTAGWHQGAVVAPAGCGTRHRAQYGDAGVRAARARRVCDVGDR